MLVLGPNVDSSVVSAHTYECAPTSLHVNMYTYTTHTHTHTQTSREERQEEIG